MTRANERSPILGSSDVQRADSAGQGRRRWVLLATGLVVVAALVVIGLNVAHNLQAKTTTSSSPEAVTKGGSTIASPPPAPALETPSPVGSTAPPPSTSTPAPMPTVGPASSPVPSSPNAPTSFPVDAQGQRDLLSMCEERHMTQPLNHFIGDGGGGTYEQRYFVCGRREFFDPSRGAVFFYLGNEADVLLYLNHTGLMWENAAAFRALLVFAEHRYFGQSMPFGDAALEHLAFLSSTQALADYARLLTALREELAVEVPVIGFGGSYGGMLGTWFRLKYPHLMDGVIAASAPVLHFLHDPEHTVDPAAFLRIAVRDMSPAAGSSANCIGNAQRAMARLRELAATPAGRATLATALALCSPEALATETDAQALIYSAMGAFVNMAMGNYPYPSSYMTNGAVELPAYPVRAACEHLAGEFAPDATGDEPLLRAFRDSVGVFLNATGQEACYFAPPGANATAIDLVGNLWGYLECSELYMPMGSDGADGLFPIAPVNETVDDANCVAAWGVHLRPAWAQTQYGGLKAIRQGSNIVFSNGDLDPWSGTGVTRNVSDSVVFVPVPGGAHHIDLFFSHPLDPPAVTRARALEVMYMRQWVEAFYARRHEAAASA